MPSDSKPLQVAKLTLTGTAFIGLGALLSVYCPAFKKPVDAIENGFKIVGDRMSSVPVIGVVFKDSPLTNHNGLTRFLAVSTFETVLAGGLIVGGGAIMKLVGTAPKHLQQAVADQAKGAGDIGRA